MRNPTYKLKEIDQQEENLLKQKKQIKVTKEKLKELKRQQQLRKEIDF